MKNVALTVAGVIFSAVAVMHVLRLMNGWEITFNHVTIPLEWSLYGTVIAAVLALFMFMATCCCGSKSTNP